MIDAAKRSGRGTRSPVPAHAWHAGGGRSRKVERVTVGVIGSIGVKKQGTVTSDEHSHVPSSVSPFLPIMGGSAIRFGWNWTLAPSQQSWPSDYLPHGAAKTKRQKGARVVPPDSSPDDLGCSPPAKGWSRGEV